MSDHMLEIDFDGTKWSEPRIVPYHNLSLDPATSVFHYATEVGFSFYFLKCKTVGKIAYTFFLVLSSPSQPPERTQGSESLIKRW